MNYLKKYIKYKKKYFNLKGGIPIENNTDMCIILLNELVTNKQYFSLDEFKIITIVDELNNIFSLSQTLDIKKVIDHLKKNKIILIYENRSEINCDQNNIFNNKNGSCWFISIISLLLFSNSTKLINKNINYKYINDNFDKLFEFIKYLIPTYSNKNKKLIKKFYMYFLIYINYYRFSNYSHDDNILFFLTDTKDITEKRIEFKMLRILSKIFKYNLTNGNNNVYFTFILVNLFSIFFLEKIINCKYILYTKDIQNAQISLQNINYDTICGLIIYTKDHANSLYKCNDNYKMFNNGNSANFDYRTFFTTGLIPWSYIKKDIGWLSLTTDKNLSDCVIDEIIILENKTDFNIDTLFTNNGKNILNFCNLKSITLNILDSISKDKINSIINSMTKTELLPINEHTTEILFIFKKIKDLNICRYFDFFEYNTISYQNIHVNIILEILDYGIDLNLVVKNNVSVLCFILYYYKNSKKQDNISKIIDYIRSKLNILHLIQKIYSDNYLTLILLIDTNQDLALEYLNIISLDKETIIEYVKEDIKILKNNSLYYILRNYEDCILHIQKIISFYKIHFDDKNLFHKYLLDDLKMPEDFVTQIKNLDSD